MAGQCYSGAHPCAGCNTPGSERLRYTKDSLCQQCQDALTKGRAVVARPEAEYVTFRQHVYGLRDKDLNSLLHLLLESVNEAEHSGVSDRSVDPIFYSSGDNCRYYTVTRQRYEAIKLTIRRAMEMEREGFAKGKHDGSNLLMQLNNGELKMSDFENVVNKKP